MAESSGNAAKNEGFSLTKLRARNFQKRRLADKQAALQSRSNFNTQYWQFAHELASVIAA